MSGSTRIYLELIDTVLNGSSFIAEFPATGTDQESAKKDLETFLKTQTISDFFYAWDKEKNYYRRLKEWSFDSLPAYDLEDENAHHKPWVKDEYVLNLAPLEGEERYHYLTNFLTLEYQEKFGLNSPYRRQLTKPKLTQGIVELFIQGLTHGQERRCYRVEPTFLYSTDEARTKGDSVYGYLDRLGCDTVTMISTAEKHFVLFTNGSD